MEIKDRNFKLFGENWKIKFVEDLKYKEDDEGYTFGITNSPSHTIKIHLLDNEGKKQPKEVLRQTLAHELIHACLDSGQYIQSSQDEPMVEWLGKCILSIIDQKLLN